MIAATLPVRNASKQFSRRTHIPVESAPLWTIESGYVRTLTWSELGKVTALGLWGPGDIVGKALSRIDPLCVECLCTVRARPVASEEGFSPDILRDRLYQHEFMHHLLFDPSTEERLLKFFYWLVERFGQVNSGKAILPVKLTHQDLAEFVGSTRVTVTRLLGQLEKRGKIQWSDRRHMELIIDNSEFAPRLRA